MQGNTVSPKLRIEGAEPMATDHIELPKGRIAEWLAAPLRANRPIYMKVAVAAALINIFALVTALFTMTVYDRVVPNNATDSLVALTIGLAIILIFDFVLKMLRAYFVDVAGARIDRDIGRTIFEQILKMRLDSKKHSTGGLTSLVREIETLRDFFASATIISLVDLPFILITLGVIAMIGGWLVMVPLAMIPLVVGSALATQPIMKRLSAETLGEAMGKQSVLVETIGNLETVKSANAGGILAQRWDDAVGRHAGVSLRQRVTSTIAITIAGTAQTMAYTGVVIFGVFAIANQTLTMGGMIACSILAGRVVAPLGTIAQLLTRMNATRTAYAQIDQFMEKPVEGPTGIGLGVARVSGTIEFRNVDFRYPDAPELALSNINLRVDAGEHIALVGPIGSGKSTIARLMIGLYPPTSGLVLVDGVDIRQLTPSALRARVGALFQESTLLTGTLRENILLGREDVDDDEMVRAAKLSRAHDFISKLPEGYDMRLADRGEGLSGGQKQSIGLARALVGRPPVIILDEPTSSVDADTERGIMENLREEFANRTLIVVTHRPSLLRLVDRIVMLSAGRVVLDGTPDSIRNRVADIRSALRNNDGRAA